MTSSASSVNRKKIMIVSTGGTIAMVKREGKLFR